MSHVRQQIRDALVTTLTGLTTTGSRVFVNRARALATSDLPALVVRVLGEQVGRETLHFPPVFSRAVEIEVECLASGASAAQTLDTICVEVETAMYASESAATAGGLLDAPLDLATIEIQFDDEVSPPLGAAALRMRGEYSTRADDPETAL